MDQKTIKEYIRALEHITGFMRTLLEEELKAPPAPYSDRDRISEITDLRLLAKSDQWPQAVPDDLICGDDEDNKLNRAAGIVHEFIRADMTDKRFLDFGCGEGHVPFVAANLVGVKLAVGYDPVAQDWNHFDHVSNMKLTSHFEEVKKDAPYDVILLNDVLDHCSNPKALLEQVKEVKSQTGRIFVRCHPWTSRHGTHLYKQLNKAYLHLVFNKEELYAMGLKDTHTYQLLDPMPAYRSLFKDAGFTVVQEEVITHPVELFFTHKPAILRRIKEKWAKSENNALATGVEFPREIMEIQFADFVLV
jgi:2-polyprenyl-3-methyl-5-hydroxy-6-metoxy-1,4-benzoquinol methylase